MKYRSLCFATFTLFSLNNAFAIDQYALIAGETASTLYAAYVASDGTVTQLTGVNASAGDIYSVGLNATHGLIGGETGSGLYAVIVYPDGTVTPLSGGGLPSTGLIYSVALNPSGNGLIGGDNGSSIPYAALVAPDGTLTQLSGGSFPAMGSIYGVAINDLGQGIIGGYEDTMTDDPLYGALVAPDGTLTDLSGPGLPIFNNAEINAVAINNTGKALIVGDITEGSYPPYVGSVATVDGTVTALTGGGLRQYNSYMVAVALNDSGNGIIGGQGGNSALISFAYAATVAPDGTLTQISIPTMFDNSIIYSAAINESGKGIIGGDLRTAGQVPYAAFIDPDATATIITGDVPVNGYIYAVDISEEGAGLIGGRDNTNNVAYAALVSPNGTATRLPGFNIPGGSIDGVKIFPFVSNILNAVKPVSSGGSSLNAVTGQLAASQALQSHFVSARAAFLNQNTSQNGAISLLASNTETLPSGTPALCEVNEGKRVLNNIIWAEPFGAYIHQEGGGNNPSAGNGVGGGLVGLDYYSDRFIVGGSVGYVFNSIHYGSNFGSANIQEELVCVYGAYKGEGIWFNAAIWGGMYQLHNERNTLSLFTSRADTDGWIFNPHIEIAGYYSKRGWYVIEPFVMFDWCNSWQDRYTEKGSSGFNLVMKSQYVSLLRTEAGLRFDERLELCWGTMILEEKISYVNQAPFNAGGVSTSFIGSASTFPVAIGSAKVQNLASVGMAVTFTPTRRIPRFVLDVQCEFGRAYQSYFAGLEVFYPF